MKKKLVITVLVLSLGLNLGIIITFGHHWLTKREFRRGPEESSWRKNKMKKELNLTDEQVKFMEQDRQIIDKEVRPIKEELQKKRKELFALLDVDNMDKAKIDQMINDLAQLQIKMEKTVIGHLITMRQHLTPDQQKKLKVIMQRGFMKMPPDMMEKGPGPNEREH